MKVSLDTVSLYTTTRQNDKFLMRSNKSNRNAVDGGGNKVVFMLQCNVISPAENEQAFPLRVQVDVRHEKTDLKVFVVVIPKEGLAGWGPANPSLGMTPTIKYYSTA